ncbi:hypothetical protein U1Q18_003811 [Sarracenia purpurea var. burkii]
MLVPQTNIRGGSSGSSPSPPSDDGGASSVDEGVAAARGVDVEPLLPPRLRCELEGVGVASVAANRECWGGVGVAYDAVDRRPRFRRLESPGEENVLPIGLDIESSGEEGPIIPKITDLEEDERVSGRGFGGKRTGLPPKLPGAFVLDEG